MAAVVWKCARLLVFGGIILAAAAFGGLFACRLAAMMPLALWGAVLSGGLLACPRRGRCRVVRRVVQDDCRLREPSHPMRT